MAVVHIYGAGEEMYCFGSMMRVAAFSDRLILNFINLKHISGKCHFANVAIEDIYYVCWRRQSYSPPLQGDRICHFRLMNYCILRRSLFSNRIWSFRIRITKNAPMATTNER